MIYCTLFDSNYLDKALVMIDSLLKVDQDAKLYVLCMNDKSFSVMNNLDIKNVINIKLEDFEDEELLSVKEKRSRGEYCWTCTAKLIYFVIKKFNEEICTYIDSDLYFYSNPKVIIDEMINNDCTVSIVKHNFPDSRNGRKLEKQSGKICVEFNTFSNETRSILLLEKWIDSCINKCSVDSAGDQMYLDDWDKYDFVKITEYFGAGVAPWNIKRFELIDRNELVIRDKKLRKNEKLIFYHFQNVINRDRFCISVEPLLSFWKLDKNLVYSLYKKYFKEIEEKKEFIEKKFDFLPMVMTYITDNRVSKKEYFLRIVKHPFKSFPLIMHRLSMDILGKVRHKKATIDVRTLLEDKSI